MTEKTNSNKRTASKSKKTMVENIKKITPAMAKVMTQRDLTHEGSKTIVCDENTYVVYMYENKNNEPCAVGYTGRRSRPNFHYRYTNEDCRIKSVNKWISERPTPAKKIKHERTLSEGDVLVSSWGYDQTNVDFYKVLRQVGKQSIEIAEIGCHKTYDLGSDSGTCTPDIEQIIGEPMIKRETQYGVRISSFQSARKLEKINDTTWKSSFWSSWR